MTRNQLQYHANREQARHNMATEREENRSNTAREAETYRSNRQNEFETQRSNKARERENEKLRKETNRHNLITENETRRHNEQSEIAGYMSATGQLMRGAAGVTDAVGSLATGGSPSGGKMVRAIGFGIR